MTKKFLARLQDGTHVIIFNQENSNFLDIEALYSLPSFENIHVFNPDYSLESDEWFFVTLNEKQKAEIIEAYLKCITNSAELNPISCMQYPDIRALYLTKKNESKDLEQIILTRILPRYYVKSKKIFIWDGEPSVRTQANSVDFTAEIDAFWDGKKLFFKSYSKIKSVFSGLEDFYRKATEEEKNDFLRKDFFECFNGYQGIKVGERNLRKIAAILENKKIDLSGHFARQKYIDYANQYSELGISISVQGKLKIRNNKDVTNILNLLEENFYTTPITGEKRETYANKKITSSN